jgi:hypothetical protein
VQAISKPDIYVESQRPRAYSANRFLADGDRMLPQGTPEAIIEAHAILPEARLPVVRGLGQGNRVLDKGAVLSKLPPNWQYPALIDRCLLVQVP